MRLRSERRVGAPQQRVWEALYDPEVLRQLLPGCERVERRNDRELAAALTVKIGSKGATFTGAVTLSDIDPPNRCRIAGEAEGGPAGFVKGTAAIALRPQGEETRVCCEVEAVVGGALAGIGSRRIDAAARQTAEDFVSRLDDRVSVAPAAKDEVEPPPEKSLSPWMWVPALIAIAGVLLVVFSRT